MTTTYNDAEKLSNPAYRKAFVASQINIGLPFQIRALMKARGWTQAQLAQKTEMLQPRISGLMTPGKTRPNIETLRRIAEAFDCGLLVRFAPFSELVKWSEDFDPESFSVPAFADDTGFLEPGLKHQRLKSATAALEYLPGTEIGATMPAVIRTGNQSTFLQAKPFSTGMTFEGFAGAHAAINEPQTLKSVKVPIGRVPTLADLRA